MTERAEMRYVVMELILEVPTTVTMIISGGEMAEMNFADGTEASPVQPPTQPYVTKTVTRSISTSGHERMVTLTTEMGAQLDDRSNIVGSDTKVTHRAMMYARRSVVMGLTTSTITVMTVTTTQVTAVVSYVCQRLAMSAQVVPIPTQIHALRYAVMD